MKTISMILGAAALACVAAYAVPALTADTKAVPAKPEPLRVAPPAPRALPAAPGSMGQVQLTFAPVVKRVVPAVVNVYARSIVQQQVNPFFNDPLFSQLFGSPEMRQRVQQSLGSGVIVRADGLILTNNHVVAGGTDIVIALSDKREFKAKVLLADPRTDLAVVKIDPKGERLPVVPFADSDAVQVGDLVLAVGDPFGVGQTVTMGIVSALARTQISASDYQFFIQTDAAINPGNSGGPLLDSAGRLIGVNTAIFSPSGANAGVGFAIPVDVVNRVVPQLIRNGRVPTPGIGIVAASEEMAARLGAEGVVVVRTMPGSPAAQAGLHGVDPKTGALGDVIVAVDGQPVHNLANLTDQLEQVGVGKTVELSIKRGGGTTSVKIQVADIARQQS